ncbi:oligosaccharide flippase family protein [Candidatus Saccharibacteria bacterium]|nr:oligosaccharide flippase family protein [Candidatus Saccharibacteria bacterium]
MKTSKQRKIGAILSYISIVANTVVQLIYTPFLVSKLGQSEYGLYSLVSSIIGYLTVLDLGFGNAIIVHTAKYRATGETEKEKALHGMFRMVYILIGLIAAAIGLMMSINASSLFGSSMVAEDVKKMKIMLMILSLNLFLTFSFSIYSSIITASEKFVYQKLVSIISTIIKPLLMIPILFMGYKSVALCMIITLVNITVLITNYIYCKKKLKISIKYQGFDKSIFKVIFGYSFYIFLTQIVDQVNWHADQFILGITSGTIAVAVYSAASQINAMFINLSTAISSIMLPKVSKMVAKKASSEELTNEMIKVGRIQFMLIFLVTSGFVLLGKEFIKMWLGDGFNESYIVTLLLIIPTMLPLIQNTGLSIMQAMNKYKFKAITTSIMAVFNIILSIFLAKAYGAIGAAVGTTIAIIICNVIMINIYYKKEIKLNIMKFWANIFWMAVKFLIPISLIVVTIYYTQLKGWEAILLYGTLYTIAYLTTAYCLVMNKYERHLVDSFFNKIPKKGKR